MKFIWINLKVQRSARLVKYKFALVSEVDIKLQSPYLGKGRNVTMDNFFTSVSLAEKLKMQSTCLIPQSVKIRKPPLYDTIVMKNNEITLTVYQGKNHKNILVLSPLHSNISIGNDQKHLPETVSFYNATKYGVDVLNQMARKYSVRVASRCWPVKVFYNILDLTGINTWVLFKQITGKRINQRVFLQMLSVELRSASAQSRQNRPNVRCPRSSQVTEQESEPAAKCQRQQCQ
ncbi:hypothetical protein PR048_015823, partial [Dryococelus australis]